MAVRAAKLAALLGLGLGFGLAASFAFCDVTLFSPTATVLPKRTAVIYGLYDASPGFWRQGSARLGLGQGMEVSFDALRGDDGTGRQSFGFEYQYMFPLADTAPGIAFGIEDAAGTSVYGRRVYAAITERFDENADLGHDLVGSFTIGAAVGSRALPFVGVRIPLGSQLIFLAEHDGSTVNAGIEFDPSPNFALTEVMRGSVTTLKAAYRIRF